MHFTFLLVPFLFWTVLPVTLLLLYFGFNTPFVAVMYAIYFVVLAIAVFSVLALLYFVSLMIIGKVTGRELL